MELSGMQLWNGETQHNFDDLVWYQLQGLRFLDLKTTLGCLSFIEAKSRIGTSSLENLLRDYFEAQST